MASLPVQSLSVLQKCWDIVEDAIKTDKLLLEDPNLWPSLLKSVEKIQKVEKVMRMSGGYRFEFVTKSEKGISYRGRIEYERIEASELSSVEEMPPIQQDQLKFLKTCVSDVLLFKKSRGKARRSLWAKGYATMTLHQLTVKHSFTGIDSIFLYLRERYGSSYYQKRLPKDLKEESTGNSTFIDFPYVSFPNKIGFFQAQVIELEGIPEGYVLGRGICWDSDNRRIIDASDQVKSSSLEDVLRGLQEEFFEVFLSKEEKNFQIFLRGYLVEPFSLGKGIFAHLSSLSITAVSRWRKQITTEIREGVLVIQFPHIQRENKVVELNAYIQKQQERSEPEGICWNKEEYYVDYTQIDRIKPEEATRNELLKVHVNGSLIRLIARIYSR